MDQQKLRQFAERVLSGDLTPAEFARALAPQLAELSSATLDLDRQERCGFPEVVFAEGKSVAQLREIISKLRSLGQDTLVTRISQQTVAALDELVADASYNQVARTLRLPAQSTPSSSIPARDTSGHVAIITAGTADTPVAEEARETLDWMGVRVSQIQDVGVAGPHRLPARLAEFARADAIVVVAGMEGALPSVVGGYVPCPVIAVPTSVGYGANLAGIAALLSMLNSCASNVTVVNIDGGFKGGYVAGLIAQRMHAARQGETSKEP